MTTCLVYCDRCKQQVRDAYRNMDATSGFYDVSGISSHAQWAKYAREGERNVCDDCMWADPKYIVEHGRQAIR